MRHITRTSLAITLLLLASLVVPGCGAPAASVRSGASGAGMGMGGGPTGPGMGMGVIAASRNATLGAVAPTVDASGVRVARVVAPAESWLVVRSVVATDLILGYTAVRAGETRDVTVPVTSLDGPRVLLALHVDGGVKGVFDYRPGTPAAGMDKPIFTDAGPVQALAPVPGYGIEVLPNTALISLDPVQPSGARAISVRYLLIPAPSWVSVYLLENGAISRRIASVSRAAGESQEIVIPLEEPMPRGDVLVMVHADRGAVGRFEFDPADPLGSADRPYTSAGVVVEQRITGD